MWAGLDTELFPAVSESGVTVTNSAGVFAVPMAEHAMALMLAFARALHVCMRRSPEALWHAKGSRRSVAEQMAELNGATLGVVGYGGIGRAAAQRAKAFGMKILASDPAITSEDAKEFGAEFVALEELLRRSDVVSLHVPATDATRGMMNAERLKLMKPTAVVINTARGVVIDEAALYDALKNGTIKAAGLDVYAKEPPVDSPLMQLENIVLTPHLASGTSEAQKSAGTVVVEKVGKFFEQKPPGEEHKLHWFKSSATQ